MISEYYKNQLRQTNGKLWIGTKAWHKCRHEILNMIDELDARSVLDFGAGEGTLCAWLKEQRPDLFVYNYDPRIEEFSKVPYNVDIVVSTDVLEHIEPELVTETLEWIREIATYGQYHCISTRKAGARLPDGRNAHLTVNPPEWWRKQLEVEGWEVKWDNQYHSIVELRLEKEDEGQKRLEG